jgi:hypothetical protein
VNFRAFEGSPRNETKTAEVINSKNTTRVGENESDILKEGDERRADLVLQSARNFILGKIWCGI